jgi:hypothetical protein
MGVKRADERSTIDGWVRHRVCGDANTGRCCSGMAGSSRGVAASAAGACSIWGSMAQGVQALGSTRQRRTWGGLRPPEQIGRLARTMYTRGARAGITRVRVRGWGSVTPADFVRESAIVGRETSGGGDILDQLQLAGPRVPCIVNNAAHNDLPSSSRSVKMPSIRSGRGLQTPTRVVLLSAARLPWSKWTTGPWLCVPAFRRVCLCRSVFSCLLH